MVNTHSFPKLCKRATAGMLSMLLAAMAIPKIPADASANGFYVSGTSIKDANGKDFVMRGVNIAHAWYSSYTSTFIKGAADNGANTVRVVVANGNKWSKTSNSELKDIVSACKDNDLVCILEVHDATGSDNAYDLNAAVNYWIENKDVLQGNEKYVILNIANEWYGSWNGSAWAEGNKTAVKNLRNANIDNMIMIDCAGWGQYPDSIKDYGRSVFEADSDKNTVFSIHMYEYAGGDSYTVKKNIDNALGIGVPVVIGEFGGQHTNGDVDEATIMSYCTQKNVGYLGWSWKGNSSDLSYLDISNDWSGTSLTSWGNTLINGSNGIRNTSKKCSIFSGSSSGNSSSDSSFSGSDSSLQTSTPASSNVHNFTTNGTNSSFFSITGNLSTSKGTVNYGGQTLTQCLKLESSTSISFNAPSSGKLTLVFAESNATIKLDGSKLTASNGVITADISAGSHKLTKADVSNLFYMSLSTSGSSSSQCSNDSSSQGSNDSQENNDPQGNNNTNVNINGVKAVSAGGWNESLYVVFSGLSDSEVTGVSYSGTTSGKLTGNDLKYLVRDTSAGLRIDIPGVPAGTYSVSVSTSKGTITQSGLQVNAQDRSGYAHYNYSSGVGAYTDKGTLKSNAIVLYVTNDNKDKVTVTSKDGTTVTGIGNILNSVGQDVGSGKTANGGKSNSNKGIIKKLAQDGTPLVVRIIGDVKAPAGLTAYDSIDYGGSVGDNGYMARMKSGKDITIEGIGTDAAIDGWGLHFMCESSAPSLGKSFEVKNIAFKNVPEDCVGMEGVQESSSLSAPVERCWIHNCEFYAPSISNPAESDKAGGDGACDFKRGQYFTNSYCYYQGYHKTNLVGASDSNLQFHITYHHNYWNKCESRGPLARQANIHMYNNIFSGQTSYCMNPRANAYIFSEYNIFDNCKNPMQVKLGAVKSYNDVLNSCKGNMDGTVVSSKSTKVSTNCKYANFDTNSSICYIPSGNYFLQTDTSKLASYFDVYGGTMDANTIVNGKTSSDSTSDTAGYPEVTNVEYNTEYHQIRFTWNPVQGAENYGIAVYLAGKWRIQTQSIPSYTTSYTTPKNLTPGMTYKVAIAAKVNGEWGVVDAIMNAVTVTTR